MFEVYEFDHGSETHDEEIALDQTKATAEGNSMVQEEYSPPKKMGFPKLRFLTSLSRL